MESRIQCPCGGVIHTDLFAVEEVYRLIRDSDYNSLEEPVDSEKLSVLFLGKGIPAYRCSQCGRLAVAWHTLVPPTFYLPEPSVAPPAPPPAPFKGYSTDARLKELEELAEAEYDALYESRSPTGAYASAKDAFRAAIVYAREAGLAEDEKRLMKRLEHVKAVFRSQFS